MNNAVNTYTKKPVEISAIQWDGSNESTFVVVTFLEGRAPDIKHAMAHEKWLDYCEDARRDGLTIKTLEDGFDARAKHVASIGDFIIRGVAGEFYPCKPEIFAATYNCATPPNAPQDSLVGDAGRDDELHAIWTRVSGGDPDGWPVAREFALALRAGKKG